MQDQVSHFRRLSGHRQYRQSSGLDQPVSVGQRGLGDELDTICLEDSLIRRTLNTPNFFFVVVSNVEGANAKLKVRIIIDSVHQLAITETSSVSFPVVRNPEHSRNLHRWEQLRENQRPIMEAFAPTVDTGAEERDLSQRMTA